MPMKYTYTYSVNMTPEDKAVLDAIQMFRNTVNRFSRNRTTKAEVLRDALYSYRDEIAKQWEGYYSTYELELMLYPDKRMKNEE